MPLNNPRQRHCCEALPFLFVPATPTDNTADAEAPIEVFRGIQETHGYAGRVPSRYGGGNIRAGDERVELHPGLLGLGLSRRGGEDRFRSLTDLKWGESESMGFSELGDNKKLEFDLTESARGEHTAKRGTLSLNDFSTTGFSRTDGPLSVTLQFSPPVAKTISSWPFHNAEMSKKLKKMVWDTEPVIGSEEVIEEAFVDVFCDLMYGGGWMDLERDEELDRNCNWALVDSLPYNALLPSFNANTLQQDGRSSKSSRHQSPRVVPSPLPATPGPVATPTPPAVDLLVDFAASYPFGQDVGADQAIVGVFDAFDANAGQSRPSNSSPSSQWNDAPSSHMHDTWRVLDQPQPVLAQLNTLNLRTPSPALDLLDSVTADDGDDGDALPIPVPIPRRQTHTTSSSVLPHSHGYGHMSPCSPPTPASTPSTARPAALTRAVSHPAPTRFPPPTTIMPTTVISSSNRRFAAPLPFTRIEKESVAPPVVALGTALELASFAVHRNQHLPPGVGLHPHAVPNGGSARTFVKNLLAGEAESGTVVHVAVVPLPRRRAKLAGREGDGEGEEPLVGIAFDTGKFLVYSLKTLCVVRRLDVVDRGSRIEGFQVNERFILFSTTNPPSLYVLSSNSLDILRVIGQDKILPYLSPPTPGSSTSGSAGGLTTSTAVSMLSSAFAGALSGLTSSSGPAALSHRPTYGEHSAYDDDTSYDPPHRPHIPCIHFDEFEFRQHRIQKHSHGTRNGVRRRGFAIHAGRAGDCGGRKRVEWDEDAWGAGGFCCEESGGYFVTVVDLTSLAGAPHASSPTLVAEFMVSKDKQISHLAFSSNGCTLIVVPKGWIYTSNIPNPADAHRRHEAYGCAAGMAREACAEHFDLSFLGWCDLRDYAVGRAHLPNGARVQCAIRGEVFDLTTIGIHHRIICVVPTKLILNYGGQITDNIFPVQVSALWNGIDGNVSPFVILDSRNVTGPNAQYHDFWAFTNDSRPDWYFEWMVQMRPPATRAPCGTQAPPANTNFMHGVVIDVFKFGSGSDVTKQLDNLKINPVILERQKVCLRNLFTIGKVDNRNSTQWQFSMYLLLSLSLVIISIIGLKLLASVNFGTPRAPEDHDKFVICQVPCYMEGDSSLQRTIDLLVQTKYDDKRKSPNCADPNLDPEPLSFLSSCHLLLDPEASAFAGVLGDRS
ncbi:hypothetical protein Hypma_013501 [Hypsizygus marmoreus]|uniref:Uncharacterized protein n=1 Tax=Hypsizygus marmoreus TaxID=39966 RepID=A0A369JBH0_HYPMA|nr:hypothetical protein Hypma_013501 [Hypsizygus marmoreus]